MMSIILSKNSKETWFELGRFNPIKLFRSLGVMGDFNEEEDKIKWPFLFYIRSYFILFLSLIFCPKIFFTYYFIDPANKEAVIYSGDM